MVASSPSAGGLSPVEGSNGGNRGPAEPPTGSAGPHRIRGAQACILDSGGPQIKGRAGQWELIGATSRDGDADPTCSTGPGIYTDLTAHRDWIERTAAN